MHSRFLFTLGVLFIAAGVFFAAFQGPDVSPQLTAILRIPHVVIPTPLPPPPTVITTGVQTRILMYHYIRAVDAKKDRIGFGLSVTSEAFEAQLKLLQDEGYQGITMSQVAQGIGGPKTVAITFDDGYEDFYTTAYPLLKKYGFNATAYIISGKIDGPYMTWDQIREIQAGGIEIGAHTIHHIDLAKATPAEQRNEIFGSKAEIEDQIHVPVISFCYPSGQHTELTEQLVKEAGFISATTTVEGQVQAEDNRFLLNRVRMSPGLDGADLLQELKP